MGRGLFLALAGAAGCTVPTIPEPGGVEVESSALRSCEHPEARSEQGAFARSAVDVAPASTRWNWGGGVMVADLDGDDAPEIVLALESGLARVHRRPDGTLDVDLDAFAGIDLGYATGGSVVDADADGDLDLYVTRTLGDPVPDGASDGRNRLLLNRGDGTFEDATDAAGVDGCTADPATGERRCYRSTTSSWGDVDGDGDLDLFVGDYGWVDQTDGTTQDMLGPGEPDVLYLNRGDGTFEDRSDELPPEVQQGYAYGGGFLDLDDDGDQDLYVVHDFGNQWPNRVLWNEGGTLTLRDDDDSGLVLSMTGMGLGVGDLDGDGRPDLAIPEWGHDALLLSAGGRWVDAADQRGYAPAGGRSQRVGWGAELGDVDDDGDLDLLTLYGHLDNANHVWVNPDRQPDALYLNEPDELTGFRLVDHGVELGVADPHSGRGGVLADLDGDGWLDLVLANVDAPADVLAARCGTGRALVVRPRMPGTDDPMAVGAKVEVVAPGFHATRWQLAGGTGFASSGPPELHFGVGDLEEVTVFVRWPDGEVSTVGPVPTGQVLTVRRLP